MTTRAASEAFFIAGTNRAMFRFTLMNHLCMDMEQVHDTSVTPDRIRQDVSRSPGGDSRVFLNNCIGCHSGMDPLAQAFAYYDFDETTSASSNYTAGVVQPKYFNNNETFADGFVTPDDSWNNHWRQGQNSLIGWSSGIAGLGQRREVARRGARALARVRECQVTKVFKAVCLRDPGDQDDRDEIETMTSSFIGNDYDEAGLRAVREVLHGQLSRELGSQDDAVRNIGRVETLLSAATRTSANAAGLRARPCARGSGGARRLRRRQRRRRRGEPRSPARRRLHYSGPAPATADVQAFKINLWENIRANNRCGTCHSAEGGQAPMFARSDDVNLAYAAANAVVDAARRPTDSMMVTKVGGGHNCWLASNAACADILTTWITNWAGERGSAAAGARSSSSRRRCAIRAPARTSRTTTARCSRPPCIRC